MTIGTLVAFMAYHMRLLSPVQTLIGMTSGLASARVSLARIFELFDSWPRCAKIRTPRHCSACGIPSGLSMSSCDTIARRC